MAEMKTERKSVSDYLSKNKFLIPMYQRAYVWGEDECEQLWDDVCNFFENKSEDENEEYFLGSTVIYKNQGLQNIIDGQQRTTTLSLLIRALYVKAKQQNEHKIDALIRNLAACLWDTDQLNGEIDYNKPHLRSEVAIDSDNDILSKILSDQYQLDKTNIDYIIKQSKSNYEKNYLFFIKKIDELAQEKPTQWFDFCLCLLNKCIVLPIECDGQENALRIFNTLNNRGVSLSVSDILKGLIYTNKKEKEDRNNFTKRWKNLETKMANSSYLKKEDIGFLFTQYEHIIRAKHKEVDTVIPATLDFFTKKDKLNSKKKNVHFAANDDLLLKDETFEFIEKLATFWCDPKDYLSNNAKKYFDILNIYQNKEWQMVVSMCFYKENPTINTDDTSNIFDDVLPQLVSYCALGLICKKGGRGGLLWGLMNANIRIDQGEKKIFKPSKNIPDLSMPNIDYFTDFALRATSRQIRYILAINTLTYNDDQEWEWNLKGKNYSVIKGEIEHIFPKKWKESNYDGWNEKEAQIFLESIGNKILIEKKINIDAGNGYFTQKKKSYKESNFLEVKTLGSNDQKQWLKEDIQKRNEAIYQHLKSFLESHLL